MGSWKAIFLVLAFAFSFASPAAAITWQGLTPARSSYDDAVKAFGKPYQQHRVDSQVDMFSFKTKNSGDGKAHVFIQRKDKRIVAIAFVPPQYLSREDIHKAFKEPDEVIRDEEGRLIEFYGDPGLMINYDADGKSVKLLLTLPSGTAGKKKTPV
ncbi:MAG TPA: hypothetical protein V6C82_09365 [Chroococcales cyanobacterium]